MRNILTAIRNWFNNEVEKALQDYLQKFKEDLFLDKMAIRGY